MAFINQYECVVLEDEHHCPKKYEKPKIGNMYIAETMPELFKLFKFNSLYLL